MNACKALSVLVLAALWSAPAFAQDPVKVDPQHYKVLVDNASVRVLKINYAPGAKSVMHDHPNAIVVPLVASKVQFTLADGKTQDMDMASESATYTPAGKHNVHNVGTSKIDAVLVEFKKPAGTAKIPTSRPNMKLKVLAESPEAVAYRTTADPTFSEPAGTKHDYDQVVIALNDAEMSLTLDGKPPRTKWARGDVQFIGRGTAHESKNVGGKPIDYIVVAIK